MATAMLGALTAGAVWGWLLMLPLIDLVAEQLTRADQRAAMTMAVHVLGTAFVVTAAGLAVGFRFREVRDLRRLVMWIVAGLVVGGLTSIAPIVLLAQATQFSTTAPVLATHVLIGTAFCALGASVGAVIWKRTRPVAAA